MGVIDIGSISACLQVADDGPRTAAYKHPTMLCREIRPDGTLSKRGIRRVIRAARATVGAARSRGVRELFCFATSSVRDAANRDAVTDAVERAVGLRLQFLSGSDEGWLTYHAARHWAQESGRMLLLDIGGGTSEIVLGADEVPDLALSLPLGAGALTRAFLHKDPPTEKDLRRLKRHVRHSLDTLPDDTGFERAIAASRILNQLGHLAGKDSGVLTLADLDKWIPRLADMPSSRRARLRGISAARAPYVLAGAIVARGMMRSLDVSEVELCPWSLREGILLRHLAGTEPLPWSPCACADTA
ncbi:Ppx/GppA phosphatase family protein [Actinokineospora soli]|uniref:Ppx/GppA phosphatase family protein n=1 Tax=Actinokineospora soli TaxID=1048753 RepID=A0ABW2TQ05_9PSEU